MLQPEIVGAERSSSHTLQAVIAGIVTLVLAILMGTHVLHLKTAAMVGFGLYAPLALWAFLTSNRNPNHRLADGAARAQASVSKGELQLETPGDKGSPKLADPARATSGTHQPSFALLAAAVFLCVAPEILRLLSGAPLNERFYPAVIGPGDSSTYYFEKEIHSVKGYWRGKAQAALLGLDDLGEDGVLLCEAEAKDNSWGQEISVVEFGAFIVYQFPRMEGSNRFEVVDDTLKEQSRIQLAGPGAGGRYGWNSWLGILGGGTLLMLACIWLCIRAGKLDGNPRQTIPVQ
jgi:hypothetical protein